MKIYLKRFLIALCCQFMFFSFQTSVSIHPFSSSNVVSDIKYLSSDNFKGRLAGSVENQDAQVYIENKFKNNQLLPLNTSYLDQFSAVCPVKTEGLPYLRVVDKNNNEVVKEYKYGTDYKEDLLNLGKTVLRLII